MQVINITPPGSTVVTAPEQVNCARAEPCRTDGILAVQGSGSNIIKGGTVHFENSNGVTFGVSKNSVTASVGAQVQSSLVFSNSNNVRFGIVGSTLTASASFSQSSQAQSSLVFSNSNSVSFGIVGSTLTASIPAFLTTAAQVSHTHGNLALTNLTGTSASNGLSLSAADSGGGGVAVAGSAASTVTSGTLQFANANGVSFGLAGSTMTASFNGLTSQSVQPGLAGVAGSGASTVTAGTLQFANLNNVSFGLNGSTMTASIPTIPGAATGVTSLNASTGQLSIAGSGLNSISNNNSTIVVSARSESLNEIQDPAGDKNFNMNTNGIQFRWANAVSTNATRDGAFEIDAQGNFDGDLLHIHQHVGAPNPVDLLHLEAAHTNVTLLRLSAAATVAVEANAPIKFTGGSVPMILDTSQSNVVSNLNAFYLQGKQSSNFLTAQSVQPCVQSLNGSSGSLSISASTNITVSNTGSTIILSCAAGGGVAIAGSAASTVTGGTVQFANLNNVSFGLNGSTMTASIPTIPAAATGVTSLNGSNGQLTMMAGNLISVSNNASSISIINVLSSSATALDVQTVSSAGSLASRFALADHQHAGVGNFSVGGNVAGTTSGGHLSNVVLCGGNNITLSGGTGAGGVLSLTVSAFNQSAQAGIAGIAGSGASTVTGGTLVFSNLNGVSFGLNGSTMSASISRELGAIGNSAGSYLSSGSAVFYDSNGVSWSVDTLNNRIVASVSQAIRAIGGSSGNSMTSGTIQFYDTNGFTWSADTLNARMLVNFPAARGIAASGASTLTNGTLQFQNSNNITFGMNGSTITASYAAVSAISGIAGSGASTVTNGTVQFGNANNMSFGLNGSTMTGSFVAQSAIADSAASSVTAGVVQFNNANGVSFGFNGSTMTASIPAGAGANITVGYWQNYDDGPNTTIALSQGSFSVQRVMIPAYMTATQLDYLMHISGAASQGLTVSQYVAIYTFANRTSANRASSTSGEIRYNSTSGGNNSYTAHSGTRYRSITMAGWNITPGDYLIGFCISTATGQTAPSGITVYGRGQLSLNGMSPTGDVTNFIDRGYFNGATSGNAALSAGASPNVTQTGSVVLAQPWIRLMS